MAIATMGVRSALQTYQASNREFTTVVEALTTPDRSRVEAAPKKTTSSDLIAKLLEDISAWIPTETLTLWLLFVTAFNVFNNTQTEIIVGFVTVVASGLYGALASMAAHDRRNYARQPKKAVTVGCIAAISFFVYWMATPGAVATADWNIQPILPVGLAALFVLFMPFVAAGLGVDAKG